MTKRKKRKETRSPLVPHAKRSVTPAETPIKRSVAQHVVTTPKSGRKKSLKRPEGQPTITGFLGDQKPTQKLSSEDDVEHCNKRSKKGNETPGKYETVSVGDSEMFLFNPETNGNEISEAVDSPSSKKDADGYISGNSTRVSLDKGDSDIEILEVLKGRDDTKELDDASAGSKDDENKTDDEVDVRRKEGENETDDEVDVRSKKGENKTDDEVDVSSKKDENKPDEVDVGSKGNTRKRTCKQCGKTKKIKTEPESYDADSTTLIDEKTETVAEAATMSDVSGAAYMSDASDSDVISSSPGMATVLTFSVHIHFRRVHHCDIVQI